jgi:hypothetical protein
LTLAFINRVRDVHGSAQVDLHGLVHGGIGNAVGGAGNEELAAILTGLKHDQP